jgi:endonuclease YncB( thermonuclease family)
MFAAGGSWHQWVAVVALLTATTAFAARAQDQPRCVPPVIGNADVATVIDGRTIRLADGRDLLLAGIEVPLRTEAAGHDARFALQTYVAGHPVRLLQLGPESDRYGRLSALVSAAAQAHSAQVALLAAGRARVAARVGDAGCAAEFLAAERTARAAGLGLWADPHYVIKSADNPADVLAERGHFTVVEGKVLSVRQSGGTIYVNFGRRWSKDFTVTVPRRDERNFSAAGMPLRNLAGHRVRVRGMVEERGGPWIEVTRPEQIEIAEQN